VGLGRRRRGNLGRGEAGTPLGFIERLELGDFRLRRLHHTQQLVHCIEETKRLIVL
jgi:hypothetical protein